MKNDANVTAVNIVLVTIIVVLCAVIGFQYLKIKDLQTHIATITQQTQFPDLELVGIDNSRLGPENFANDIHLLFVFKNACIACSHNFIAWRNLANFYTNQIHVIGIIPDGQLSSLQFQADKKPNFPLYIPYDVTTFAGKLRIDTTTENTLVIYNNKIIAAKAGTLSGNEMNNLLTLLKKLIDNHKENNYAQ